MVNWPEQDTWLDARVEAFLDGELSGDERAAFAEAAARDPRWDAELRLARHIREGLRTLPPQVCPPRVTAAVLARARREENASWFTDVQDRVRRQWLLLWQPALAMAVLVLLVVSAAVLGRPAAPPPMTAEVREALAEVQWTLGYLSEVGRQTGQAVRHDVFEQRVVTPVREALTDHPEQPNGAQR